MQLTNRIFKASAASVIGLMLLASMASAQGKVSPDEARAIAKEAYIFHYPLVYYYRTMYRQAIDPSSDTYRGFGKWLHLGVSHAGRSGHPFAQK